MARGKESGPIRAAGGRFLALLDWLDRIKGRFEVLLILGGVVLILWLLLLHSFGVFGTLVFAVAVVAIVVGGFELRANRRARNQPTRPMRPQSFTDGLVEVQARKELLDERLADRKEELRSGGAIQSAYKLGTNRPRTNVTRLTNLRSRAGEWGEDGVTNVKVEYIAADQFPLARDIASVFESLPGWSVSFYMDLQHAEWFELVEALERLVGARPGPNLQVEFRGFEGVEVKGFLSHLVNDIAGALDADGVWHVIPIHEQLQVTTGNPKYRSSQSSIRIRVGFLPPTWPVAGGPPVANVFRAPDDERSV